MEKCKCGLNPNYMQDEEQQKWEQEFIDEHGICNACYNEQEQNDICENCGQGLTQDEIDVHEENGLEVLCDYCRAKLN